MWGGRGGIGGGEWVVANPAAQGGLCSVDLLAVSARGISHPPCRVLQQYIIPEGCFTEADSPPLSLCQFSLTHTSHSSPQYTSRDRWSCMFASPAA